MEPWGRLAEGPTVIVYILAVAVLNIAVGFTLAMHLGQRYRTLLAGGPSPSETFLDDPASARSGLSETLAAGAARPPDRAKDEAVPGGGPSPEGQREEIAASAPATENVAPGEKQFQSLLEHWWQGDPDHARQIAVALLDVDEFAQVNEQYGVEGGDSVLQAIARLIEVQQQGESILSHFAGQQVFMIFPDADARYATGVAERLRQTIEATRFECDGQTIYLTTSCAVVAGTAADTPASLSRRVEEAIRESKRYGRNRTFVNEGQYATPVLPPKIAMKEQPLAV